MLAPSIPRSQPQYTPRQRAVLPGGALDRWIVPLKRLLPFIAVVTLIGVLVLTLSARQEFSFIVSKDKVAHSSERLRVERAVYRGADTKGRPFSVSAGEAVQRSSATPIVEMRDLTANMTLDRGPAHVIASGGLYDIEHDRLTLTGPVNAVQGGYKLNTGQVMLDIKTEHLVSNGPVAGGSALGAFAANHLEADVLGERVVLSGGTHLHLARRTAK